jgi:hypothetical protein
VLFVLTWVYISVVLLLALNFGASPNSNFFTPSLSLPHRWGG